MMSKKPNESREYISSWFETISAYYDEQHKSLDNEIQEDRSDDNQMLMEVFRNYARAISRDKLRENEVIDAMREYFQITPVPVHPFAKEIEELRMFYRKQYEEGVSQKIYGAQGSSLNALAGILGGVGSLDVGLRFLYLLCVAAIIGA
jgi:hypothetical protein